MSRQEGWARVLAAAGPQRTSPRPDEGGWSQPRKVQASSDGWTAQMDLLVSAARRRPQAGVAPSRAPKRAAQTAFLSVAGSRGMSARAGGITRCEEAAFGSQTRATYAKSIREFEEWAQQQRRPTDDRHI